VSRLLEADTYVAANPETGDRARLVATVPTTHAENCVCAACLAARTFVTPLELELRAERGRADSIVRLDTYQRRLLHTFTARWNADRARRGQHSPIAAHDALTQGLEALVAMVTEGAKSI
jgi:hypothetical protein